MCLSTTPMVTGDFLRFKAVGNGNPDPDWRWLVPQRFTLGATNYPASIAAPKNLRVVCHPHAASRHVPIRRQEGTRHIARAALGA